jgi:multidrug efflux pump subunit AcrA (membrane-fusion protein)
MPDKPSSIIQPLAAKQKASPEKSGGLGRTLFAVVMIACIAIAIAYISDAPAPQSATTHLTHTITRGALQVTVTEQGALESSDNTEITCKVRGQNTITWVIENGTYVEPGDELVRLDTLYLEEAISDRIKYANWTRSGAENWRANMQLAEISIEEYLEGDFETQKLNLEKNLRLSESNLLTAQSMLEHAKMMHERGYVSELEVDKKDFNVRQAQLEVEVNETQIDALINYTKKTRLETLNGAFKAAEAQFKASDERARADVMRRDQALEEYEHCIVKAEKSGMVIYPQADAWKDAPEIAEGATVHKNQVLLLMPDLDKMQVKVGVHESIVDKIKAGIVARVTLPDKTLEGEVISVASVASPAGWWTGNVVKYDTIVKLPSAEGLKPGMSAEVELILAEHADVATIPVAAVLETQEGYACWVPTPEGPQRRTLALGDSNDQYIVIESGLDEGDEVYLNPLAFVEEAQLEAMEQYETVPIEPESTKRCRTASTASCCKSCGPPSRRSVFSSAPRR